MSDNLSISISADTSKARADLALLQQSAKSLRGELNGLAKDVQQGRGDASQLAGPATKLLQTEQAIVRLRKETQTSTQANRAHTASLKEMGLELGHVAHAAGLPIEGLRALRAGFIAFAAVEVFRGITSAIKQITDLSEAAAKAGTTVERLKSMQSAMRATGQSADDAAPLIAKMSEALRQSRLTPVFDPKGPFESLMGVSAMAYRPGAAEDARATRDAARELLRMRGQGRVDEANAAAQRLFGQTVDQNLELIQRIANDALPKVAAATEADIAAQKEYNQHVANAASLWDKVTEAIGRTGIALANATANAGVPLSEVGAAATASGDLGVGGVMASGGYVRGPGTGTSDSILARLSNGEFVINAGAVQRLGTGFLHSLNSFASGGLVGMPPIRFAAGGLASATAGGRPVHLHLGSRSFALSGSSGVVDSLVSEANWQQMRSAGVKPSWFAGKPR